MLVTLHLFARISILMNCLIEFVGIFLRHLQIWIIIFGLQIKLNCLCLIQWLFKMCIVLVILTFILLFIFNLQCFYVFEVHYSAVHSVSEREIFAHNAIMFFLVQKFAAMWTLVNFQRFLLNSRWIYWLTSSFVHEAVSMTMVTFCLIRVSFSILLCKNRLH